MKRFWIAVCLFVVIVLALAIAGSRTAARRTYADDPLPSKTIGKLATLSMFGMMGLAVWAYICQGSLNERRLSIMSILGLVGAVAVAIRTGMWLLSDTYYFWPD
jgi:hypothetical protein